MRFRHTPSIARVADAWFDRRTVPPHVWSGRVGRSMDLSMGAFLDAEGDKLVRSPLTGKDVKLKSLTGEQYQDDDKSKELLGREYERWKKQRGKGDDGPTDSGDDAPYQGPKGQGTGTKEREKDEVAAREQADAEASRAKTKSKADADAKSKADAAAKAEADEKKRRQDVRQNVVDLGAAVDKAKADLEAAKKAKYDRAGQRDVAVAEAEQNLKDLRREYRDAVRAHSELTDQEAQETDQKLSADLDAAQKSLDDSTAEVAGAEKNLEAAKASGNASEMARAAKALAAANAAKEKAELEYRQADNSLALHRYAEVERMSKVTQQVVDDILSGEGVEPGFVVYDQHGNAQRYNPERTDQVYSYMMGLLGEDAEIHKAEEIEYRRSEYFADPKDKGKGKGKSLDSLGGFGGFGDWDDWDDSDQDAPTSKKPPPVKLQPTKSKKPRNPDGSSPTGMEDDDYGPGEFWRTKGGLWAAKNPKGQYDTFARAEQARAFAMPTAPSARVASRYIERMAL